MSINYSEITSSKTIEAAYNATERLIREAEENDGAVYLSDALVNISNGGNFIIEYLGKRYRAEDIMLPPEQRNKYIIQVLRDEWGNAPKKGDKLRIKYKKNLRNGLGKLRGSDYELQSKISGRYEDEYFRYSEHVIDEKGCVKVGFEDAIRMLNINGVHGVSGRPLTNKPEHSTEPVNTPEGGKKHVWYWRYKELTREQYEALKPFKNKRANKTETDTSDNKGELNV
jgi:hypothetical protein